MTNHYINIGADSFEAIKKTDYVDKSLLIDTINSFLGTSRKLICVSRPRRFGKTSAIKMLAAYYNCELDTHYLFDDLKISQQSSYQCFINKFNVLYFDTSEFIINASDKDGIVKDINEKICKELHDRFPETVSYNTLFETLSNITSTEKKFIVLIDEWDALFRECSENVTLQEEYIDFLRSIFKTSRTDSYLAGAYMTGILPIKKYGTHSALNNFEEFTMIDSEPFSEYIGFTEAEVRELCLKYQLDFAKMKQWYDGYVFDDLHIYNPKSVQSVLLRKKYRSYWVETETYLSLKKYIQMNFEGLRDSIVLMVNKGRCKVNTRNFQNDMTSINSRDDVLTLLVHLGYLAFDDNTQEVYIPNEEILEEFKNTLDEREAEAVIAMYSSSTELKDAIFAQDELAVAKIIDDIHMQHASIIKYNDENSLANVLSIGLVALRNEYSLVREIPAGRGFADVMAIPVHKPDLPCIIIELKWDKSARTALQQIKDRKYPEALNSFHGDILLVGINYDKVSKQHECRIEKYVKQ